MNCHLSPVARNTARWRSIPACACRGGASRQALATFIGRLRDPTPLPAVPIRAASARSDQRSLAPSSGTSARISRPALCPHTHSKVTTQRRAQRSAVQANRSPVDPHPCFRTYHSLAARRRSEQALYGYSPVLLTTAETSRAYHPASGVSPPLPPPPTPRCASPPATSAARHTSKPPVAHASLPPDPYRRCPAGIPLRLREIPTTSLDPPNNGAAPREGKWRSGNEISGRNGGGRRESRKREMREWEGMWRGIGEVVGRDGEQGKGRETGRERMMKGWRPKREESARCGSETRRTGTVERKMKLLASLNVPRALNGRASTSSDAAPRIVGHPLAYTAPECPKRARGARHVIMRPAHCAVHGERTYISAPGIVHLVYGAPPFSPSPTPKNTQEKGAIAKGRIHSFGPRGVEWRGARGLRAGGGGG
ncbi:hypothetical protein DFH09DRAFT_1107748 [Mycena vulgaris]|nr:hypothetical protein DFH09DRAFT_1107748 [Mycena vulgaris]